MDQPPGRQKHAARAVLVLVAIVGAALLLNSLRDDTPPLNSRDCDAARAVWERRAIRDYTIELRKELDRQPPETVRTVVRNGRPTSLTIDGAPVTNRDTYTVHGLFELIERELEMAGSSVRQPGQPEHVMLRAVFDSETGVPMVFKRLAGHGRSVVLTVTGFEVAHPGGQPDGSE